jgi:hypothetical protein
VRSNHAKRVSRTARLPTMPVAPRCTWEETDGHVTIRFVRLSDSTKPDVFATDALVKVGTLLYLLCFSTCKEMWTVLAAQLLSVIFNPRYQAFEQDWHCGARCICRGVRTINISFAARKGEHAHSPWHVVVELLAVFTAEPAPELELDGHNSLPRSLFARSQPSLQKDCKCRGCEACLGKLIIGRAIQMQYRINSHEAMQDHNSAPARLKSRSAWTRLLCMYLSCIARWHSDVQGYKSLQYQVR